MPSTAAPKGIIFDLGDVLFTWSSSTTTTIPSGTMRKMLSSAIWASYDCGRIDQETCYRQLAQRFSAPVEEVEEAFLQARDSLQPNRAMMTFIREIANAFQGKIKLFAMSNISKEDWAFLSTKIADWTIFDRVFTSGYAGMRKPDSRFYRFVLEELAFGPEELVFVDDRIENVLAARSLGVSSILFDNDANVIRRLRDTLDSQVGRGYQYLYRHVKRFDSITDNGHTIPDNFAQLLMLEITEDQTLVSVNRGMGKRTWNFFAEKPVLVPNGSFPDDLDTTALALTVLQPDVKEVTTSLDEMLTYLNSDGTIQTYFDRARPRTDAIVSANVLACFYRFGRGHQLQPTLRLVRNVLHNRSYLQGTRYYPSADCCLFFIARLLGASSDAHLQATLRPLLTERTRERVRQDGNALDLASRILACSSLGIECGMDRRALMDLQCEDGGWEAGWIYRFGSTGVRLGNKGVTTAMAVKALSSGKARN